MNMLNKSLRLVRRNAVFIVIALLAVLVYSQRKSFKKQMGGGGSVDPAACEGLCGDLISAIPAGGYLVHKDGSVENETGKHAVGSEEHVKACALGKADSAPASAPPTRRRR